MTCLYDSEVHAFDSRDMTSSELMSRGQVRDRIGRTRSEEHRAAAKVSIPLQLCQAAPSTSQCASGRGAFRQSRKSIVMVGILLFGALLYVHRGQDRFTCNNLR